jgi:hypothetical protein
MAAVLSREDLGDESQIRDSFDSKRIMLKHVSFILLDAVEIARVGTAGAAYACFISCNTMLG